MPTSQELTEKAKSLWSALKADEVFEHGPNPAVREVISVGFDRRLGRLAREFEGTLSEKQYIARFAEIVGFASRFSGKSVIVSHEGNDFEVRGAIREGLFEKEMPEFSDVMEAMYCQDTGIEMGFGKHLDLGVGFPSDENFEHEFNKILRGMPDDRKCAITDGLLGLIEDEINQVVNS